MIIHSVILKIVFEYIANEKTPRGTNLCHQPSIVC